MLSRNWLWTLSASLILIFPVLSLIYWSLVLKSGVLPVESDSIGIPISNDIMLAILASPIVLAISWLCLRRFNPRARLGAWRSDRPVRSLVATLLFGGVAGLLMGMIVLDFRTVWPWYEHIWTGYLFVWIWWLLAMRSALIEQLSKVEIA